MIEFEFIPVLPPFVAALELRWIKEHFSVELQSLLLDRVVDLRCETSSGALAFVVVLASESQRQTREMDLIVKKLRSEIKSHPALRDHIHHVVVTTPFFQVPVYAKGRF
jgi:hypothetical protein